MCSDSRWVSGSGGLLLGTDLTQADVQAEYSCLALDFPSPALKLTTDGKSFVFMCIFSVRLFGPSNV